MLYILLAILTSSAVSITLKFAEKKGQSGYAILCLNYLFATLIAFVKMLRSGGLTSTTPAVILMGSIAGFFYLFTFILCQRSIRQNGAVLTATFMKMGILVPILLSQILWKEEASMIQFIGIGIAIVAIFVLTYQGQEKGSSSGGSPRKPLGLLMMVLLLSSGMADAMAKFYNYYGIPEANDVFIFLTFFVAMLMAFILMLTKKEAFTPPKSGFGAILGAVNYGSALFLLLAMDYFPSYFVYPIVNALTISFIAMVCMFFFGEKLNRRQMLGIGLVLLAVVLLNL